MTQEPSAPNDGTVSQIGWRGRLELLPRGWFIAGVAVSSCLIVLYFFCPHFKLWKGIDFPLSWNNGEVNRAIDTLKQVENPFVPTENPTNLVINWRLLFPLIAHYLHFPRWLFLALPHIGCLVLLALTAHQTLKATGNRLFTLLSTCLMATASWFFTSMGLLTYFDSWLVLGLMLVVGFQSRLVLLITACATPWIDERFIIALPVCVGLRAFIFRYGRSVFRRKLFFDALVAGLPTLCYVLLRYFDSAKAHSTTDYYLREFIFYQRDYWRLVEGWWHGLRGLWVFVFACLWFMILQSGRWWNLLFTGVVVLTLGVSLLIAGDLSRSMAVFAPMAWVGIIHLWQKRRDSAQRIVAGALAFNLLTPATHVVTTFKVPWHNLDAEWDWPLPDSLNPLSYNQRANVLYQRKQFDEAMRELDVGQRLDPEFAMTYLNRATMLMEKGEFFRAMHELDTALRIDPKLTQGYYFRGIIYQSWRMNGNAIRDYQRAVELGGPQWNSRKDCSDRLAAASRSIDAR